MTDKEKMFIDLNKQFLYLRYKATRYEMNGIELPDYLKKNLEDLKRKVRLIDKAVE
jgi:hypothetical protein